MAVLDEAGLLDVLDEAAVDDAGSLAASPAASAAEEVGVEGEGQSSVVVMLRLQKHLESPTLQTHPADHSRVICTAIMYAYAIFF